MEIKIGDRDALVPDDFVSPHKAGMVWHNGWEIPTLWALDANKIAYVNDAHGGSLQQCQTTRLLELLRDHEAENTVRRELRLKPRLPSWARHALSSGWTPPATFNREDYEEG